MNMSNLEDALYAIARAQCSLDPQVLCWLPVDTGDDEPPREWLNTAYVRSIAKRSDGWVAKGADGTIDYIADDFMTAWLETAMPIMHRL